MPRQRKNTTPTTYTPWNDTRTGRLLLLLSQVHQLKLHLIPHANKTERIAGWQTVARCLNQHPLFAGKATRPGNYQNRYYHYRDTYAAQYDRGEDFGTDIVAVTMYTLLVESGHIKPRSDATDTKRTDAIETTEDPSAKRQRTIDSYTNETQAPLQDDDEARVHSTEGESSDTDSYGEFDDYLSGSGSESSVQADSSDSSVQSVQTESSGQTESSVPTITMTFFNSLGEPVPRSTTPVVNEPEVISEAISNDPPTDVPCEQEPVTESEPATDLAVSTERSNDIELARIQLDRERLASINRLAEFNQKAMQQIFGMSQSQLYNQ